ncbi:hypothetical protein F1188_11920 [Roseospira marina]|uniref:Uncharacterized protein n=1 Tax=Roseospira marina TaxID=140057 RepID=A0A5M6IBZ8_9PROT|nr:hypothetical protein F1188_11920 [Roseospira marina]
MRGRCASRRLEHGAGFRGRAQGAHGHRRHTPGKGPTVISVTSVTRAGTGLSDDTRTAFTRRRHTPLIESPSGRPYRISPRGRVSAPAHRDNPGT